MSSSSASSSSKSKSKSTTFGYDFFIILRDPDEGRALKASLENSLQQAGFTTFFDDDDGGGDLKPQQENRFSSIHHETIKRCRFVLFSFTQNFQEADLYLTGVEDVLWYRDTMNKIVLPVLDGGSQEQVHELLESSSRRSYDNMRIATWLSGYTLLPRDLGMLMPIIYYMLLEGVWIN
ncbi:uncharacterized protein LOC129320367 isoform X2 [Prosopis cineraria]|uniref:uncharacterized protein LOC129320367 isoform X2 n=1 Tax=Prosopis cineraria TaxID=364024 RepID=UPI00241058EE|nr:uncharacterized protein LOC129320367 isoform X2 [Prosopis cineraria]